MRIYPENCIACRICELACSFHHERIFNPAVSSIEITKHDAIGDVEVDIHTQAAGNRRICDSCQSESIPLCIKWCPAGVLGK